MLTDLRFRGSGDNGKGNWKSNSTFMSGVDHGFTSQEPPQAPPDTGIRNSSIDQATAIAHRTEAPFCRDLIFGDFLEDLQDAAAELSPDPPGILESHQYQNVFDIPQIKLEQCHVDGGNMRGERYNAEHAATSHASHYDCTWTGM